MWERVNKIRKSEMNGNELFIHFDNQLKGMGSCPNLSCNCVDVLANGGYPTTVVRYLYWLNGKTKYEQDSIVFEWLQHAALRKSDVSQGGWKEGCKQCVFSHNQNVAPAESSSRGFSWR